MGKKRIATIKLTALELWALAQLAEEADFATFEMVPEEWQERIDDAARSAISKLRDAQVDLPDPIPDPSD